MKCSNSNCQRPATHGLSIRLWAKGFQKLPNNFMTMSMPLPLCLGHACEIEPKTFFIDESWKRIESAILGIGRALPDRDTAEIVPEPLRDVQGMMREAERRTDTIVMEPPEKQH